LPVFDMMTFWAVLVRPTFWLANVRLEGARLTWPESPVPDTATVSGLSEALSVKVMAAVRVPDAEGVNFTLIVQEAFTSTTALHRLVCVKSLALGPVTVMASEVKLALPVLVRVMV